MGYISELAEITIGHTIVAMDLQFTQLFIKFVKLSDFNLRQIQRYRRSISSYFCAPIKVGLKNKSFPLSSFSADRDMCATGTIQTNKISI